MFVLGDEDGSMKVLPLKHHIGACFPCVKSSFLLWNFRSELEVDSSVTAEMIPGFATMNKEDQSMLQKKLGTSKGRAKKTAKKRKEPPVEKKSNGHKKLKEETKEKTEEEKKEEENMKVIMEEQ